MLFYVVFAVSGSADTVSVKMYTFYNSPIA